MLGNMNSFFNKLFTKVCFYYMSKGLDNLLKLDMEVQERLQLIENNTVIKLAILGYKEQLLLQKSENRFLVCKNCTREPDLTITFKCFSSLPKILFGTSSVTECYLNDEFFVKGELRYAVTMVFAIEKFMAYLLPKKKYAKVYKRHPENAIKKSKMFGKLLFAKRGRV